MATQTVQWRKTAALGLGAALLMHVALGTLLSLDWGQPKEPPPPPPLEVDLIADTAMESAAPVIADTVPPARLGESEEDSAPAPLPDPAPPEPAPRVPPEPVPSPPLPKKLPPPPKPVEQRPPQPVKAKVPPPKAAPPKAQPAPRTPAPKTPPKTKAPPAKAPAPKAPTKGGTGKGGTTKGPAKGPTGRLDGITDGLTKQPGPKTPPAAPAATVAAVKKSIDVSIKAKVAPHWNRCKVTGVDIDSLKTVVRFRLTPSGGLAGFTGVETTGQNDSNRFQVQRHQECAKRAVELAVPFDLPEENYSFWQNYTLDFIKK